MIATDRLDLTLFTLDSAQAMLDGTDGGDRSWAEGFPRDDDRDAARMFLRAPDAVFGSWLVVVRDHGEVVGTIGFFGPPDSDGSLMVGYGLVAPARQRGYATEALRAVAEYGLAQLAVKRIVADPELDNVASHRVLEKAGFGRTHSTDSPHWYERR